MLSSYLWAMLPFPYIFSWTVNGLLPFQQHQIATKDLKHKWSTQIQLLKRSEVTMSSELNIKLMRIKISNMMELMATPINHTLLMNVWTTHLTWVIAHTVMMVVAILIATNLWAIMLTPDIIFWMGRQ